MQKTSVIFVHYLVYSGCNYDVTLTRKRKRFIATSRSSYTRFLWVLGGIGRSKFTFDRTNLALYWQFDSTSEKIISSPDRASSSGSWIAQVALSIMTDVCRQFLNRLAWFAIHFDPEFETLPSNVARGVELTFHVLFNFIQAEFVMHAFCKRLLGSKVELSSQRALSLLQVKFGTTLSSLPTVRQHYQRNIVYKLTTK